eukprot:6801139-Prymnesium_polylepis.1
MTIPRNSFEPLNSCTATTRRPITGGSTLLGLELRLSESQSLNLVTGVRTPVRQNCLAAAAHHAHGVAAACRRRDTFRASCCSS